MKNESGVKRMNSPAEMDRLFKNTVADFMLKSMEPLLSENKIKHYMEKNALEVLVWGLMDRVKKPISSLLDVDGNLTENAREEFEIGISAMIQYYEMVTKIMRALESERFLERLIGDLKEPGEFLLSNYISENAILEFKSEGKRLEGTFLEIEAENK